MIPHWGIFFWQRSLQTQTVLHTPQNLCLVDDFDPYYTGCVLWPVQFIVKLYTQVFVGLHPLNVQFLHAQQCLLGYLSGVVFYYSLWSRCFVAAGGLAHNSHQTPWWHKEQRMVLKNKADAGVLKVAVHRVSTWGWYSKEWKLPTHQA